MRTTFCRPTVFFRTGFILILFAGIWGAMPVHAAPSAFSLISPANGASVLTKVLLDWGDSTDPKGGLTYTVFLCKRNEQDNSCGYIPPIEGIDRSCRLLESGIDDKATYDWKVRAVNQSGDYFETEVRHFKTDNNANPVVAWIGGHVYSKFQNSAISNIKITTKIWDKIFSFKTDLKGAFCGELNPDKVMESATENITIEISAEGCKPQYKDMTIVPDELREFEDVTLEFDGIGDINGDCYHDLKDAILALQILSGQQPSQTISRCKDAALDPNPNKKIIGLAELIYILQRIVNPSPCSKNSATR